MRLIPVITAVLVTLALYGIVFQRDALIAYAVGDASAAQPMQQDAKTESNVDDVAPEPTARAIGVVVLRSEAQTVDRAVVVRGQTQANRQVAVRAETTATVISEPLRKGAYVETGDLLCQLNPGTRQASLAEAHARLTDAQSSVPASKARLEEALARLEEAKINDNAAAKLSQGGYASDTRVASAAAAVRAAEASIAGAESGVVTAKASIEAASAGVAAAEREIERLTITAPFEGLLETDTAELGSLLQPGSLCGTIIQLDPIKLVGYVPETEVARVTVGALAGAELASGHQVQGRVIFLSRSADPLTRTFLVEILVDNTDLSIRDGQTAEIVVSSDGALAHKLPQSSLTLNNDGTLGVRTVGPDNLVSFAEVDLLRDESDGIWVTGLPDQIDVIVVGQDFVTDGVLVTPTYREITQ